MPRAQLVVAREPPQQPIGRLYLPHKHSKEKGGPKFGAAMYISSIVSCFLSNQPLHIEIMSLAGLSLNMLF